MGYKILGFVVWKGARAYLRWRVSELLTRRHVAAGVVLLAIGAAVAESTRRQSA